MFGRLSKFRQHNPSQQQPCKWPHDIRSIRALPRPSAIVVLSKIIKLPIIYFSSHRVSVSSLSSSDTARDCPRWIHACQAIMMSPKHRFLCFLNCLDETFRRQARAFRNAQPESTSGCLKLIGLSWLGVLTVQVRNSSNGYLLCLSRLWYQPDL